MSAAKNKTVTARAACNSGPAAGNFSEVTNDRPSRYRQAYAHLRRQTVGGERTTGVVQVAK